MDHRELSLEVLRIRMIEEEIGRRYKEQEMRCPVHLSIGQEACAVGVAKALTHSDLMVSTHRSHAHYLAKGGDLARMLCELYGKAYGCSRGQGGSMHLTDWSVGFVGSTSIVGGTIPVGVGLAFAMKQRKEKNIAVVCLGDAAVEEGVFHESANFASLHKLPVLFVIENNEYSCYTHLRERQPRRLLSKLAFAHNLKYKRIKGAGAKSVYRFTKDIVDQIRLGSGPWVLELETHRLVEHCGPNNDDELGYKTKATIDRGIRNDPISRCSFLPEERESIDKEIELAFQFAKAAAFPDASELGKYTYA